MCRCRKVREEALRLIEQLEKWWIFWFKWRKQVCRGARIEGRRFWRRVKNRPSRKEWERRFLGRVETMVGVMVGVLVVVEKRFGKCISGKWKKDAGYV